MSFDPIAALVALLRERHPGLWGAYLFGSRATGLARMDSDWDIGLLGARFSPADLRSTAASASIILEAETDLVDLRRASTVLKAEVLRHGHPICTANPAEMARFEMEALTEYQNLNEGRRHILRDFGMAA